MASAGVHGESTLTRTGLATAIFQQNNRLIGPEAAP